VGIGQPVSYGGNKDIAWSHNLWSRAPVAAAVGPGDIVGDPDLVNPSGGITVANMAVANFVKKATSPGVDAGKSLAADYTTDFFKNTIVVWDMGIEDYDSGGGGTPPPGGGTGNGNVQVGVATVAGTTNTTDNDLLDSTALAGGTPKAALIVAVETGTDETATTHAKLSYGATSGSVDISINTKARNGQNPSSVRAGGSGQYVPAIQADGSTSYAFNSTAALIANGVRLSKAVSPSEATDILGLLFAGSDVSAKAGTVACANAAGSTAVVTGLGFAPNLIFFFNYSLLFNDDTEAAQNVSFGFATAADNQCHYSFHEYNAISPTENKARIETGYVAREINATAGTDQAHELTAVSTDGFTITTRLNNGTKTLGYLAVNIANVSVNLSTYSIGATGVNTFSTGMRPQSLMLLQTHLTALATTTSTGSAGAFGIGFLNGGGQKSVAIRSQVGATSSASSSYRSTSKVVFSPTHDAATGIVGTGALTTTGWTLNLTNTVSGAYGIAVAIERPADPPVRKRIRTMRQGLRHAVGFGIN